MTTKGAQLVQIKFVEYFTRGVIASQATLDIQKIGRMIYESSTPTLSQMNTNDLMAKGLDEAMNGLKETLKDIRQGISRFTNHEKAWEKAREFISKDADISDVFDRDIVAEIVKKAPELEGEHYVMYTAFLYLTAIKKVELGKIGDAIYYASHSHYYLGRAESYCHVDFKAAFSADRKRKKSASHGGKALSQKYQPVKEEAIRLLRTNRPTEGWQSQAKAAAALHSTLADFIQNGDYGLDADAIHDTFLGWMRSEGSSVATAFKENSKSHIDKSKEQDKEQQ